MLKALIFDFDGLILDTEWPVYQAWRRLYAEAGQELDLQRWGRIVGGEADAGFHPLRHLEALTGRRYDKAAVEAQIHAWEMEALRTAQPMPGVVALLRQAHEAGLPLAIASSSLHAWVDGHLKRLNLMPFFRTIVCRDDVTQAKPAPDLFLLAASRLGVRPGEVVVLEDSPNGVLAARRAGMRVVAVPNRVTRGLKFNRPDWTVDSLEAVSLATLAALLSPDG